MKRLVYIFSLVLCLSGCTSIVFQPDKKTYVTPQMLKLTGEDVYFHSGDSLLHGWWLHAKQPAKGTVLFVHGNAQNISTHIASVYWLPAEGYDVFLFDYRGYGLSQGEPDLPGVHQDYAAALDYLFKRPGANTKNVFVFGQSLGAAVALVGTDTSAYKSRLHAVIVEGAFTSYRSVAREKLASHWLTWVLQWPLSLTIDDDYQPVDHIAGISPTPVLLIHSEQDEVIPYHNALELYKAAHEPKSLWTLKNVAHIQAFNKPENRKRLLEYLEAHLAR
ncbi:MAG: alpha/beta fold hydrolase [Gammaproteobacteria bacterium]|nr:alpha/beta fold hydrolase [Gammaproteobacteria bacterium]